MRRILALVPTVSRNGVRLYFSQSGEGPAVLFHTGGRRRRADVGEPAPPWLIDNLAETSGEIFALTLDAWARATGAWEVIRKIQVPTLIAWGEDEEEGAETELAAARLPDGEAAVLPGFGHLQTFWHAEVTAPLVLDFLAARGIGG
jgi:pimeloyl-ACP methyl ester carboxylesterase